MRWLIDEFSEPFQSKKIFNLRGKPFLWYVSELNMIISCFNYLESLIIMLWKGNTSVVPCLFFFCWLLYFVVIFLVLSGLFMNPFFSIHFKHFDYETYKFGVTISLLVCSVLKHIIETPETFRSFKNLIFLRVLFLINLIFYFTCNLSGFLISWNTFRRNIEEVWTFLKAQITLWQKDKRRHFFSWIVIVIAETGTALIYYLVHIDHFCIIKMKNIFRGNIR